MGLAEITDLTYLNRLDESLYISLIIRLTSVPFSGQFWDSCSNSVPAEQMVNTSRWSYCLTCLTVTSGLQNYQTNWYMYVIVVTGSLQPENLTLVSPGNCVTQRQDRVGQIAATGSRSQNTYLVTERLGRLIKASTIIAMFLPCRFGGIMDYRLLNY